MNIVALVVNLVLVHDSDDIIPYVLPDGGTCGRNNGYICEPGYCCSQYGYSGDTFGYCGSGCQSDFGECW